MLETIQANHEAVRIHAMPGFIFYGISQIAISSLPDCPQIAANRLLSLTPALERRPGAQHPNSQVTLLEFSIRARAAYRCTQVGLTR